MSGRKGQGGRGTLSVLPGPWFPKLYSRQDKLNFTYTLVRSCSPQACCLSQSDPKLLLQVRLATCICASLPTLHPRPRRRLPLPLCVSSWVSVGVWLAFGSSLRGGSTCVPAPRCPASNPTPAPRLTRTMGRREGAAAGWTPLRPLQVTTHAILSIVARSHEEQGRLPGMVSLGAELRAL